MKFLNVRHVRVWVLLNLHHVHCVEDLGRVNHTTIAMTLFESFVEQLNLGLSLLYSWLHIEAFFGKEAIRSIRMTTAASYTRSSRNTVFLIPRTLLLVH